MLSWWVVLMGCTGEPREGSEPEEGWQCVASVERWDTLAGELVQTGLDAYDPERIGRILWTERDDGPDGQLDSTTAWTYGEDDEFRRYEQDEGADGTIEVFWEERFDSEGRAVESTTRHLDSWDTTWFTYEQGHLVLAEEDRDGDGEVDRTRTYTYDAEGQLVEKLEVEGDLVIWSLKAYDEQGRQISEQFDVGQDGSWELEAFTTYTDPVLRVGFTEHTGYEGHSMEYFEYDEQDAHLYQGHDKVLGGELEIESFSTYDEHHLIATHDHFWRESGPGSHYVFLYERDDQAHLVRELQEQFVLDSGEKLAGTETTYSFEGTCP